MPLFGVLVSTGPVPSYTETTTTQFSTFGTMSPHMSVITSVVPIFSFDITVSFTSADTFIPAKAVISSSMQPQPLHNAISLHAKCGLAVAWG